MSASEFDPPTVVISGGEDVNSKYLHQHIPRIPESGVCQKP